MDVHSQIPPMGRVKKTLDKMSAVCWGVASKGPLYLGVSPSVATADNHSAESKAMGRDRGRLCSPTASRIIERVFESCIGLDGNICDRCVFTGVRCRHAAASQQSLRLSLVIMSMIALAPCARVVTHDDYVLSALRDWVGATGPGPHGSRWSATRTETAGPTWSRSGLGGPSQSMAHVAPGKMGA